MTSFNLDALRQRLLDVSDLGTKTGKRVTIRIFPVIHSFPIPKYQLRGAFADASSVLLEMKPEILRHMQQGDSHCGVESNIFWQNVVDFLSDSQTRCMGAESNLDACQMQYRYRLFWEPSRDSNVCCQIRITSRSTFLRHIPLARFHPRKAYYNLSCSEIENLPGFLKKVRSSKNRDKTNFRANFVEKFRPEKVGPDARVILYFAAPFDFYVGAMTIDKLVSPMIGDILSFIKDRETYETALGGLSSEVSNAIIEWSVLMYQRDRSIVKKILKEAAYQLQHSDQDVTIVYVCGALHETSIKRLLTLVETDIRVEVHRDQRFGGTNFALPKFFLENISPDIVSVLYSNASDMHIRLDPLGDFIAPVINDHYEEFERAILATYLARRWGHRAGSYKTLREYYAFEESLLDMDRDTLVALVKRFPLTRKITRQDLPLRA